MLRSIPLPGPSVPTRLRRRGRTAAPVPTPRGRGDGVATIRWRTPFWRNSPTTCPAWERYRGRGGRAHRRRARTCGPLRSPAGRSGDDRAGHLRARTRPDRRHPGI